MKLFVFIFLIAGQHLFGQVYNQTPGTNRGSILVPSKKTASHFLVSPKTSIKSCTDTNYILTNINVSRSPQQVLIPPGMQKAFVLCSGTAEILVVDLVTATIEKSISLNCFPDEMIMNSSGTKIYVAALSSQPATNYPPDDCGTMGIAIGPSPIKVINTQTQTIEAVINNSVSCRTVLINEAGSLLVAIGAESYINVYDLNTYQLLHTYNLSTLSGYISQPKSAAITTDATRLFVHSVVFVGSGVAGQTQVIDLTNNTFHTIVFDTLGYESNDMFNSLMLSPDGNDLYLDAGGSSIPPYTQGTLIIDPQTEFIKTIAFNLSIEAGYIPYSDTTAFFDDFWLFGNKTLFDHKNYEILSSLNVEGCSGAVSPDKVRLYITQIGATHDVGITYGSPQKYDITFVDLATGTSNTINVSDETFTCSFERKLAMTTDGQYVITTNSALNTVSVMKIPFPVSIPEVTETEGFKIYPNPTNGGFVVEMKPDEEMLINIRIFDVMGRIVYDDRNIAGHGLVWKQINLNERQSGLYNVVVTAGDKIFSKKIVLR